LKRKTRTSVAVSWKSNFSQRRAWPRRGAAEDIVDRAAPYPPVPDALRGDHFEFRVPVEFVLVDTEPHG
jgi:hypothetical protein